MLGELGLEFLHLLGIDALQDLQRQELPLPEVLLSPRISFKQFNKRFGTSFSGIVQAHLHHPWVIGKRLLPNHLPHERDKQRGVLQGKHQQDHLLPPAFVATVRHLVQAVQKEEKVAPLQETLAEPSARR